MLAGDEKRIQALFCELALQDRSDTPRFEKLWPGAEVTAPFSSVCGSKWSSLTSSSARSKYAIRRSKLVVVTAILVSSFLLSLALWSQSRKPDRVVASIPTSTSLPNTDSVVRRTELISTPPKSQVYKRSPGRRSRHTAKVAIVQEAATIASWQSPTATFLELPAIPILSSLPQLNQSVKELESFLPNGEGKESNQ